MHHERCLELSGYEVLKAFPGVESHLHTLRIPIFANDQDMERLAAVVSGALDAEPAAPGFLIRGHGLYAWGRAVSDAVRHVEAFEFLFECEALSRQISRK